MSRPLPASDPGFHLDPLQRTKLKKKPQPNEGEAKTVDKSRVVVVSNRLPIRATRDLETGRWTFSETGGGLVTAMQGVRNEMNFLWIGWVGVEVEESERVSFAKAVD